MAFHYLKNTATGETRTIRTESLSRYQGAEDWRIFDTEEERDALVIPENKWAINATSLSASPIKIARADFARYRSAGYALLDTEAEARAACKTCYYVDGLSVGKCTAYIRDKWKREGVTRDYYETPDDARAHFPPSLYVLDRCYGDSEPYRVPDREDLDDDYAPYQYVRGKTEEECWAQIPNYYVFSTEHGRYVKQRRKRTGISRYRVVRQLVRALTHARSHFYTWPGNAEGEFGQAQLQTRSALATLAMIFTQSERATTPEKKKAATRELVERLNSMSGTNTVLLCPDCGVVAFIVGYGSDINDQELCEHCANHYRNCATCLEEGRYHTAHRMADMIQDEDSGNWFCLPDHRPTLRDPPNGALMAYSTDVLKRKERAFALAQGETRHDLWMGWELECFPVPSMTQQDCVKAVRDAFGDYVICKSDSSVGGNGFEIVSIPATLQWHRENTIPFLRTMRGKIEGWKHNSAGLHIHVGRKELTRLQEGRMSAFVDHPANSPFISKIAGRDPTTYCNRVLKKMGAHDQAEGRYHALNFATKNGGATAEYRIFRSNVSPLGFLKALEFVHCAVMWARTCGNLECAPSQIGIRSVGANPHKVGSDAWYRFNDQNAAAIAALAADTRGVQNFIAYARTHRGEYPKLWQWLQENGYASGLRYEPVSVGE